jgi:chaperone BCS1
MALKKWKAGTSPAEAEKLGTQLQGVASDRIVANRWISMAALQGTFIRHNAKDAVASTREHLAVRQ